MNIMGIAGFLTFPVFLQELSLYFHSQLPLFTQNEINAHLHFADIDAECDWEEDDRNMDHCNTETNKKSTESTLINKKSTKSTHKNPSKSTSIDTKPHLSLTKPNETSFQGDFYESLVDFIKSQLSFEQLFELMVESIDDKTFTTIPIDHLILFVQVMRFILVTYHPIPDRMGGFGRGSNELGQKMAQNGQNAPRNQQNGPNGLKNQQNQQNQHNILFLMSQWCLVQQIFFTLFLSTTLQPSGGFVSTLHSLTPFNGNFLLNNGNNGDPLHSTGNNTDTDCQNNNDNFLQTNNNSKNNNNNKDEKNSNHKTNPITTKESLLVSSSPTILDYYSQHSTSNTTQTALLTTSLGDYIPKNGPNCTNMINNGKNFSSFSSLSTSWLPRSSQVHSQSSQMRLLTQMQALANGGMIQFPGYMMVSQLGLKSIRLRSSNNNNDTNHSTHNSKKNENKEKGQKVLPGLQNSLFTSLSNVRHFTSDPLRVGYNNSSLMNVLALTMTEFLWFFENILLSIENTTHFTSFLHSSDAYHVLTSTGTMTDALSTAFTRQNGRNTENFTHLGQNGLNGPNSLQNLTKKQLQEAHKAFIRVFGQSTTTLRHKIINIMSQITLLINISASLPHISLETLKEDHNAHFSAFLPQNQLSTLPSHNTLSTPQPRSKTPFDGVISQILLMWGSKGFEAPGDGEMRPNWVVNIMVESFLSIFSRHCQFRGSIITLLALRTAETIGMAWNNAVGSFAGAGLEGWKEAFTTKRERMGQNGDKMSQNGQNWTKMGQNGPKSLRNSVTQSGNVMDVSLVQLGLYDGDWGSADEDDCHHIVEGNNRHNNNNNQNHHHNNNSNSNNNNNNNNNHSIIYHSQNTSNNNNDDCYINLPLVIALQCLQSIPSSVIHPGYRHSEQLIGACLDEQGNNVNNISSTISSSISSTTNIINNINNNNITNSNINKYHSKAPKRDNGVLSDPFEQEEPSFLPLKESSLLSPQAPNPLLSIPVYQRVNELQGFSELPKSFDLNALYSFFSQNDPSFSSFSSFPPSFSSFSTQFSSQKGQNDVLNPLGYFFPLLQSPLQFHYHILLNNTLNNIVLSLSNDFILTFFHHVADTFTGSLHHHNPTPSPHENNPTNTNNQSPDNYLSPYSNPINDMIKNTSNKVQNDVFSSKFFSFGAQLCVLASQAPNTFPLSHTLIKQCTVLITQHIVPIVQTKQDLVTKGGINASNGSNTQKIQFFNQKMISIFTKSRGCCLDVIQPIMKYYIELDRSDVITSLGAPSPNTSNNNNNNSSNNNTNNMLNGPNNTPTSDILNCYCGNNAITTSSNELYIDCDVCHAWSHGQCVGVFSQEDIYSLGTYHCLNCTKSQCAENALTVIGTGLYQTMMTGTFGGVVKGIGRISNNNGVTRGINDRNNLNINNNINNKTIRGLHSTNSSSNVTLTTTTADTNISRIINKDNDNGHGHNNDNNTYDYYDNNEENNAPALTDSAKAPKKVTKKSTPNDKNGDKNDKNGAQNDHNGNKNEKPSKNNKAKVVVLKSDGNGTGDVYNDGNDNNVNNGNNTNDDDDDNDGETYNHLKNKRTRRGGITTTPFDENATTNDISGDNSQNVNDTNTTTMKKKQKGVKNVITTTTHTSSTSTRRGLSRRNPPEPLPPPEILPVMSSFGPHFPKTNDLYQQFTNNTNLSSSSYTRPLITITQSDLLTHFPSWITLPPHITSPFPQYPPFIMTNTPAIYEKMNFLRLFLLSHQISSYLHLFSTYQSNIINNQFNQPAGLVSVRLNPTMGENQAVIETNITINNINDCDHDNNDSSHPMSDDGFDGNNGSNFSNDKITSNKTSMNDYNNDDNHQSYLIQKQSKLSLSNQFEVCMFTISQLNNQMYSMLFQIIRSFLIFQEYTTLLQQYHSNPSNHQQAVSFLHIAATAASRVDGNKITSTIQNVLVQFSSRLDIVLQAMVMTPIHLLAALEREVGADSKNKDGDMMSHNNDNNGVKSKARNSTHLNLTEMIKDLNDVENIYQDDGISNIGSNSDDMEEDEVDDNCDDHQTHSNRNGQAHSNNHHNRNKVRHNTAGRQAPSSTLPSLRSLKSLELFAQCRQKVYSLNNVGVQNNLVGQRNDRSNDLDENGQKSSDVGTKIHFSRHYIDGDVIISPNVISMEPLLYGSNEADDNTIYDDNDDDIEDLDKKKQNGSKNAKNGKNAKNTPKNQKNQKNEKKKSQQGEEDSTSSSLPISSLIASILSSTFRSLSSDARFMASKPVLVLLDGLSQILLEFILLVDTMSLLQRVHPLFLLLLPSNQHRLLVDNKAAPLVDVEGRLGDCVRESTKSNYYDDNGRYSHQDETNNNRSNIDLSHPNEMDDVNFNDTRRNNDAVNGIHRNGNHNNKNTNNNNNAHCPFNNHRSNNNTTFYSTSPFLHLSSTLRTNHFNFFRDTFNRIQLSDNNVDNANNYHNNCNNQQNSNNNNNNHDNDDTYTTPPFNHFYHLYIKSIHQQTNQFTYLTHHNDGMNSIVSYCIQQSRNLLIGPFIPTALQLTLAPFGSVISCPQALAMPLLLKVLKIMQTLTVLSPALLSSTPIMKLIQYALSTRPSVAAALAGNSGAFGAFNTLNMDLSHCNEEPSPPSTQQEILLNNIYNIIMSSAEPHQQYLTVIKSDKNGKGIRGGNTDGEVHNISNNNTNSNTNNNSFNNSSHDNLPSSVQQSLNHSIHTISFNTYPNLSVLSGFQYQIDIFSPLSQHHQRPNTSWLHPSLFPSTPGLMISPFIPNGVGFESVNPSGSVITQGKQPSLINSPSISLEQQRLPVQNPVKLQFLALFPEGYLFQAPYGIQMAYLQVLLPLVWSSNAFLRKKTLSLLISNVFSFVEGSHPNELGYSGDCGKKKGGRVNYNCSINDDGNDITSNIDNNSNHNTIQLTLDEFYTHHGYEMPQHPLETNNEQVLREFPKKIEFEIFSTFCDALDNIKKIQMNYEIAKASGPSKDLKGINRLNSQNGSNNNNNNNNDDNSSLLYNIDNPDYSHLNPTSSNNSSVDIGIPVSFPLNNDQRAEIEVIFDPFILPLFISPQRFGYNSPSNQHGIMNSVGSDGDLRLMGQGLQQSFAQPSLLYTIFHQFNTIIHHHQAPSTEKGPNNNSSGYKMMGGVKGNDEGFFWVPNGQGFLSNLGQNTLQSSILTFFFKFLTQHIDTSVKDTQSTHLKHFLFPEVSHNNDCNDDDHNFNNTNSNNNQNLNNTNNHNNNQDLDSDTLYTFPYLQACPQFTHPESNTTIALPATSTTYIYTPEQTNWFTFSTIGEPRAIPQQFYQNNTVTVDRNNDNNNSNPRKSKNHNNEKNNSNSPSLSHPPTQNAPQQSHIAPPPLQPQQIPIAQPIALFVHSSQSRAMTLFLLRYVQFLSTLPTTDLDQSLYEPISVNHTVAANNNTGHNTRSLFETGGGLNNDKGPLLDGVFNRLKELYQQQQQQQSSSQVDGALRKKQGLYDNIILGQYDTFRYKGQSGLLKQLLQRLIPVVGVQCDGNNDFKSMKRVQNDGDGDGDEDVSNDNNDNEMKDDDSTTQQHNTFTSQQNQQILAMNTFITQSIDNIFALYITHNWDKQCNYQHCSPISPSLSNPPLTTNNNHNYNQFSNFTSQNNNNQNHQNHPFNNTNNNSFAFFNGPNFSTTQQSHGKAYPSSNDSPCWSDLPCLGHEMPSQQSFMLLLLMLVELQPLALTLNQTRIFSLLTLFNSTRKAFQHMVAEYHNVLTQTSQLVMVRKQLGFLLNQLQQSIQKQQIELNNRKRASKNNKSAKMGFGRNNSYRNNHSDDYLGDSDGNNSTSDDDVSDDDDNTDSSSITALLEQINAQKNQFVAQQEKFSNVAQQILNNSQKVDYMRNTIIPPLINQYNLIIQCLIVVIPQLPRRLVNNNNTNPTKPSKKQHHIDHTQPHLQSTLSAFPLHLQDLLNASLISAFYYFLPPTVSHLPSGISTSLDFLGSGDDFSAQEPHEQQKQPKQHKKGQKQSESALLDVDWLYKQDSFMPPWVDDGLNSEEKKDGVSEDDNESGESGSDDDESLPQPRFQSSSSTTTNPHDGPLFHPFTTPTYQFTAKYNRYNQMKAVGGASNNNNKDDFDDDFKNQLFTTQQRKLQQQQRWKDPLFSSIRANLIQLRTVFVSTHVMTCPCKNVGRASDGNHSLSHTNGTSQAVDYTHNDDEDVKQARNLVGGSHQQKQQLSQSFAAYITPLSETLGYKYLRLSDNHNIDQWTMSCSRGRQRANGNFQKNNNNSHTCVKCANYLSYCYNSIVTSYFTLATWLSLSLYQPIGFNSMVKMMQKGKDNNNNNDNNNNSNNNDPKSDPNRITPHPIYLPQNHYKTKYNNDTRAFTTNPNSISITPSDLSCAMETLAWSVKANPAFFTALFTHQRWKFPLLPSLSVSLPFLFALPSSPSSLPSALVLPPSSPLPSSTMTKRNYQFYKEQQRSMNQQFLFFANNNINTNINANNDNIDMKKATILPIYDLFSIIFTSLSSQITGPTPFSLSPLHLRPQAPIPPPPAAPFRIGRSNDVRNNNENEDEDDSKESLNAQYNRYKLQQLQRQQQIFAQQTIHQYNLKQHEYYSNLLPLLLFSISTTCLVDANLITASRTLSSTVLCTDSPQPQSHFHAYILTIQDYLGSLQRQLNYRQNLMFRDQGKSLQNVSDLQQNHLFQENSQISAQLLSQVLLLRSQLENLRAFVGLPGKLLNPLLQIIISASNTNPQDKLIQQQSQQQLMTGALNGYQLLQQIVSQQQQENYPYHGHLRLENRQTGRKNDGNSDTRTDYNNNANQQHFFDIIDKPLLTQYNPITSTAIYLTMIFFSTLIEQLFQQKSGHSDFEQFLLDFGPLTLLNNPSTHYSSTNSNNSFPPSNLRSTHLSHSNHHDIISNHLQTTLSRPLITLLSSSNPLIRKTSLFLLSSLFNYGSLQALDIAHSVYTLAMDAQPLVAYTATKLLQPLNASTTLTIGSTTPWLFQASMGAAINSLHFITKQTARQAVGVVGKYYAYNYHSGNNNTNNSNNKNHYTLDHRTPYPSSSSSPTTPPLTISSQSSLLHLVKMIGATGSPFGHIPQQFHRQILLQSPSHLSITPSQLAFTNGYRQLAFSQHYNSVVVGGGNQQNQNNGILFEHHIVPASVDAILDVSDAISKYTSGIVMMNEIREGYGTFFEKWSGRKSSNQLSLAKTNKKSRLQLLNDDGSDDDDDDVQKGKGKHQQKNNKNKRTNASHDDNNENDSSLARHIALRRDNIALLGTLFDAGDVFNPNQRYATEWCEDELVSIFATTKMSQFLQPYQHDKNNHVYGGDGGNDDFNQLIYPNDLPSYQFLQLITGQLHPCSPLIYSYHYHKINVQQNAILSHGQYNNGTDGHDNTPYSLHSSHPNNHSISILYSAPTISTLSFSFRNVALKGAHRVTFIQSLVNKVININPWVDALSNSLLYLSTPYSPLSTLNFWSLTQQYQRELQGGEFSDQEIGKMQQLFAQRLRSYQIFHFALSLSLNIPLIVVERIAHYQNNCNHSNNNNGHNFTRGTTPLESFLRSTAATRQLSHPSSNDTTSNGHESSGSGINSTNNHGNDNDNNTSKGNNCTEINPHFIHNCLHRDNTNENDFLNALDKFTNTHQNIIIRGDGMQFPSNNGFFLPAVNNNNEVGRNTMNNDNKNQNNAKNAADSNVSSFFEPLPSPHNPPMKSALDCLQSLTYGITLLNNLPSLTRTDAIVITEQIKTTLSTRIQPLMNIIPFVLVALGFHSFQFAPLDMDDSISSKETTKNQAFDRNSSHNNEDNTNNVGNNNRNDDNDGLVGQTLIDKTIDMIHSNTLPINQPRNLQELSNVLTSDDNEGAGGSFTNSIKEIQNTKTSKNVKNSKDIIATMDDDDEDDTITKSNTSNTTSSKNHTLMSFEEVQESFYLQLYDSIIKSTQGTNNMLLNGRTTPNGNNALTLQQFIQLCATPQPVLLSLLSTIGHCSTALAALGSFQLTLQFNFKLFKAQNGDELNGVDGQVSQDNHEGGNDDGLMSSNDNDDGYNDDDDYDGDDDYDYYNESGDDIGDGTGKHRSVGFAGQIKKQPRKNTNRKTTEKRKTKTSAKELRHYSLPVSFGHIPLLSYYTNSVTMTSRLHRLISRSSLVDLMGFKQPQQLKTQQAELQQYRHQQEQSQQLGHQQSNVVQSYLLHLKPIIMNLFSITSELNGSVGDGDANYPISLTSALHPNEVLHSQWLYHYCLISQSPGLYMFEYKIKKLGQNDCTHNNNNSNNNNINNNTSHHVTAAIHDVCEFYPSWHRSSILALNHYFLNQLQLSVHNNNKDFTLPIPTTPTTAISIVAIRATITTLSMSYSPAYIESIMAGIRFISSLYATTIGGLAQYDVAGDKSHLTSSSAVVVPAKTTKTGKPTKVTKGTTNVTGPTKRKR